MNIAKYAVLTGLSTLALVSTSCMTTSTKTSKPDYLMAMDSLRTSARAKGIPREKVYYQFQLYGTSSTRMECGARGGYTSSIESWDLSEGFRVHAIKHHFVGTYTKVIPLKNEDSYFAPGSRLRIKEKYYHEPKLEPYFDEISLVDRHNQLVTEIGLPRESSAEQVMDVSRPTAFQALSTLTAMTR